MKEIIFYVLSSSSSSSEKTSSSSSDEKEESVNNSEHGDIDMMTSPSPNHVSMVALDGSKGTTSAKKEVLTSDKLGKQLLQANLDNQHPSFYKTLYPSHVGGKFKLHIPSDFCNTHLPKEDVMFNLEDDEKKKYPVKYLASEMVFTSGWKKFSTVHGLVEGDTLVFKLVEPSQFQVYIVKSNKMDYNEGSERKGVLTGHKKVLERAKELGANLEYPSFVKVLCPSHISGSPSRLRLPFDFCDTHLPNKDVMINLEDEKQENYKVKYAAQGRAFTTAWKFFTTAHGLVVGDALVFHLVKSTKFQVYIFKANSTDGENIDARPKQTESCEHTEMSKERAKRHQNTAPFAAMKPGEKSEGANEAVGLEDLDSGRFLRTTIEFKDIKSLQSFSISVNGSIIDCEISEQVHRMYYELCCSQKAFLHDNFSETIDPKLAAGIITQTIKIAEGIRASNLSTSTGTFAEWDKHLAAFEQLGLNVAFVRTRIQKLVNLVNKSKEEVGLKRNERALNGRNDAEEEIKKLKAKHAELKEALKTIDMEIETLEYKSKFQAEVGAPW